MAKARVDLKGITRAVDRVTKQLERMQAKSVARSARSDIGALQRSLLKVRALVADECPPGMFCVFELGEAKTTRKRPRARTTRKATRK